jgi:NADPH:quinone reductase-like Zn-dependent oxidoreductase
LANHKQRFGEHGRRDPKAVAKIWADFDHMVATGAIKPVVYKKQYQGLESIVNALEDMESRKVWGRAVVTISDIESSKSRI